MPLVTETLLNLIGKQVEAHGTVVWFDPQRSYLELARSLEPKTLAQAAVHRYEPERGFVWLRRQLEPLWHERTTPPRLIIYVPAARSETNHALIEFEVAGTVMCPGQQPPECNTALASVARRALEALLPSAKVDQVVGQVEAGQLSLAELDRLAEQRVEAQTGVLATIFESGNAAEVALRFLTDPALDAKIEAREALDNLADLLSDELGVRFPADEGPAGLRARVVRRVLTTDLIEALGDQVPEALRTSPVAERAAARQAAVALARAWRNRRDAARSYVHWSERVQAEIGIGALDLGLDALARTETFSAGEVCLQKEVETALALRPSLRLVELAEARLQGFWATQKPELKGRWDVIVDAGRVLVEAARVENDLRGRKPSAEVLFSRYALGDRPWCALDTAQRHLERDFHNFELDVQQHSSLVQLVSLARQRYAAVSDHLAELFTRAYERGRFELPGVTLQADIYREVAALAAGGRRVAYILVDALRFEMARELAAILEQDWQTELAAALATPPTVTEVGMAALMPGAEGGLALVAVEGGGLATVVAGRTLNTRQDRLDHFAEVVGSSTTAARLDQLAPLSDSRLDESIRSAAIVLITAADEIDGLCESNPSLARRMLDDVLNQLRRAVKTLLGLGIERIVVSADHGFLFGERLEPGERIDAPGGKTAALKRRVWVGKGGDQSDSFLRAPLSAFGIGGELEIATPWNLACFKVRGGSTEYFHGGLSLQEMVIPVLTVSAAAVPTPITAARLQWVLELGSRTISTRFLSVTVEARSEELLPVEPPAVRVEVRAGDQPISVPVSASYGFEEATKDVQLALDAEDPRNVAKNTVTLMITETPPVETVTVHLLDATTGVSLMRRDRVPFSISL
jgi:hypothetical protein